jgi:hypothetical protein
MMSIPFQVVIDCHDPESLASFWAAALGYVLEPPPEGFATWDDFRRDIGFPESELGMGADSIIDPATLRAMSSTSTDFPALDSPGSRSYRPTYIRNYR